MNPNFYSYIYDEAERSMRFYKDLTDDDVKYLEAAVRRDGETCYNLLDKYFRIKMPNSLVKRPVWRRDKKNDIYVYKVNRRKKSDAGWLGEGIYFYGCKEEAERAVEYGPFLQPFYINIENLFKMDVDLHNAIVHANDAKVSARMTQYLEKHKMDGVLWTGDSREEWCVLEPNQLKRIGVTRDDEGRIIPVTRRFDKENPDNRF